jgi:hypothetical protein
MSATLADHRAMRNQLSESIRASGFASVPTEAMTFTDMQRFLVDLDRVIREAEERGAQIAVDVYSKAGRV